MALSDVEIWAELNAGRLVIDPNPGARIGPSSVDLLLGPELLVLPPTEEAAGITVSPSDVRVMNLLKAFGKPWDMGSQGNYKLQPYRTSDKDSLVLGNTLETVTLPSHLSGRIEGKSSLARLGLAVHITAPTIIAGFRGPLTLGMEIAQLILEHLGLPPTSGYAGQFQDQPW